MNVSFKKTSLALATVAAVSLGGVGTANAETELVVTSWGGAYTTSQQKAYSDP